MTIIFKKHFKGVIENIRVIMVQIKSVEYTDLSIFFANMAT